MPIEHQEGPSGDLYAMPQKSKKNKGKEEELMGEKASLYSVPDKKRQKRSGGVSKGAPVWAINECHIMIQHSFNNVGLQKTGMDCFHKSL